MPLLAEPADKGSAPDHEAAGSSNRVARHLLVDVDEAHVLDAVDAQAGQVVPEHRHEHQVRRAAVRSAGR